MLLQRLATGATGVKQARHRQGPTRGSEALVRACAVYTQPLCVWKVPVIPPSTLVLYFSVVPVPLPSALSDTVDFWCASSFMHVTTVLQVLEL